MLVSLHKTVEAKPLPTAELRKLNFTNGKRKVSVDTDLHMLE